MPTNRLCLALRRNKIRIRRQENISPMNIGPRYRHLSSHLEETVHRFLEPLTAQGVDSPCNCHATTYSPRRQRNNRSDWTPSCSVDDHSPLLMSRRRWAGNNRTELAREI